MRCDERDFALRESRLLTRDVTHQPLRREHPRVRGLPIVLNSPVAARLTHRFDNARSRAAAQTGMG